MTPFEDADSQRLDEAVSARLRRLSTSPVDLSRLEKHVQREVPSQRPLRMRLFRPLTAVAAGVAILAVIGAALLVTSSNEVLASPAQMAQFHQDIVSNRIPVMRVNSIDEAGRALAGQWPGTPGLPRAPEAHVMACCMKSIKDKKVACVLLSSEGTPITMSVANASDMKSAAGKTVVANGMKYHVQSTGSLNMVSTERNGRWVCLIGELPAGHLIAITEKLQF